ncbi:hypothetical protein FSPOR_7133 [Fusarium sporotrichioides]|uniref:Uncharacterized protein n=1 Tax=Fusarium sporotrichioides TaxID=5514 RepID=A0A395RZN9_FUSSP|nr:hypothetical protein FSPOR_7133 [Fusarium sporotrichioides]
MVAIHAYKASALMAILLPFTIQAAPAIPTGKSMEVKPETRIPVADYLLEPSIPNTDGIDQIIDAMKDEKEEKAPVSQEEITSSNPDYFPWGEVYLNREEHHIPDDDDDSEESEARSDDKVKRGMVEGVVDDTASKSAYETIHHKILDTNETTTANEPRYNRMEQYSHRPTLLHEDNTHKVVPQIEKFETKQD